MTLQMTQNKKIQDLLYFKGKIIESFNRREVKRDILIKRESKTNDDYNLNIMVSINI